jgi:Calcineurin-like phosphoesterase/Purple acid Phosphatase, N-terminal domain
VRIFLTYLFICIISLSTQALAQPTITRGPYLQKSSSNSIIIKWSTSEPTDSTVRYGRRINKLKNKLTTTTPTKEHEIEIQNLKSATKYFYTVGTTQNSLIEANKELFFTTHPKIGKEQKTRFWVIGDSGRGNQNQLAVYQGYLNFATRTKQRSNLWLMLGDNAYNSGRDSEYQAKLFDIYKELLKNTVLWPTLGNHDGYSASSFDLSGPYYEIFSLPSNAESGGIPSNTEAYYSFDYGNIHFICLNSYDVDRLPSAQMATWLTEDLKQSKQKWKIAYWHHPPYSKGSHDSDREVELIEMRQNLVPILEQGGVDLVLSGHSHAYERSMLINGHYGDSSTLTQAMILNSSSGDRSKQEGYLKKKGNNSPGTVYIVAGNAALVGGGELNHPVMKTSQFRLGSLVVDVYKNTLTTTFIDIDGYIVEKFSIDKGR